MTSANRFSASRPLATSLAALVAVQAAQGVAVTITAFTQDEPVDASIDALIGDYYGPDGSGLGTSTAWLARPERL